MALLCFLSCACVVAMASFTRTNPCWARVTRTASANALAIFAARFGVEAWAVMVMKPVS